MSKTPRNEQPDQADYRLITAAEVAKRLGTSKSHVQYLRRSDPTFPVPIKLGAAFNSAARWVEGEVLDWIACRMALRDEQREPLRKRATELANARVG